MSSSPLHTCVFIRPVDHIMAASRFSGPVLGGARLSPTPVISVVDDDELIGQTIEALLHAYGFEAYRFPSARAFLMSPQRAVTTCLILDVQMPEMGGPELHQRLIRDGAHIHVIFMTGIPDSEVRESLARATASAVLTKPFDGSTLLAAIRDAGKHEL